MKIPNHIAIIMDGNGRWAQERRLPRIAGHRQGIERVKEVVREAKRLKVKILTIFAFSTENWRRPKREIEFLFSYLDKFLKTYTRELMREDIQLNIIGSRSHFNERLSRKIEDIERLTRNNKSFIFNIALDYGGRWDIVEATKKIVNDVQDRKICVGDINEALFKRYLSLGELSDPDLLIRTSGEQRLSNFLLWNLAYAECYFPRVYWPDFDRKQLLKAVAIYDKRERRFGAL